MFKTNLTSSGFAHKPEKPNKPNPNFPPNYYYSARLIAQRHRISVVSRTPAA
jgi:hypothetical protein